MTAVKDSSMASQTYLKIKERMAKGALLATVLLLVAPIALPQSVSAEPLWPTTSPAAVCGNAAILGAGPTTAPEGAVTVPAGDNESVDFQQANTTYWFEPGVHTLGNDIYGQIIPGNNAIFIGAPGAVLDGQNINRFAFTQQATNVTIKYLEVRNFGPGAGNNDEGVINHDAGEGWVIENNYVHNNDGAGVFLGTDTEVRNNCLKDNGQYGFSSYHPNGVTNVLLENNEITGNNQDDWEALREGCGCTGGGKFWDTRQAVIKNNWVHGNKGTGLWADHNNAEFLFEGNLIENNEGIGLFYEVSYNFMIKNNAFIGNGLVEGKERADNGDPFPTGAIYLSESGGDSRAGSQYVQSEVKDNLFENNWDGVILWENSDRFCRPNEEFDTTNGCPFFDQTWGLRYKTQNVKVHHNQFSVDRQAIECTNNFCGRNALFSNYGTHPTNSPYLGTVTQEAITFDQGNEWHDNDYDGQWLFMPHDMGNHVNFATWQAAPYSQDDNSTFSGDPGAPVTPPNNPPTPVIHNHLDANTSSLEASVGDWSSWYSANVSRSDEAAHTGTHSLKVDVTSPWGWGAELSSWPGFEADAGLKTISFWGKLGSGNSIQPKMTVKWFDENMNVLQSDAVTLPTLTSEWQKTAATVEAPTGTAVMRLYLTDSAALAGDSFYLDDFVVGNAPNIASAESADFETSLGEWTSWYSATVAHDTTTAFKGSGSLRVDITDPWGWAAQTDNWPGFETTAGSKKVSFQAKQGTGSASTITLRIKWYNAEQQQLQQDDVSLENLTTSWQKGQSQLSAPAGTTHAFLEIYGDDGTTGDKLYLDDISIVSLD